MFYTVAGGIDGSINSRSPRQTTSPKMCPGGLGKSRGTWNHKEKC